MDSAAFLTAVHAHVAACTKDGQLGLNGYMWKTDDEEGMHLWALDVAPHEAWALFLAEAAKVETRQIAFCLDRFAKPHQGTTLSDLVAGAYLEHAGEHHLRPFIIEYQAKPKHRVLWFNWDNAFWNRAIRLEMRRVVEWLVSEDRTSDPGFTNVTIDSDGTMRPIDEEDPKS